MLCVNSMTFKNMFLRVGVFCLLYMCVLHGAHGVQKEALDPLELELQKVGSHHVGTRS